MAATIGAGILERRAVVRAMITQLAADAGLTALSFDVADVGLSRFVATDVRIGNSDDEPVRAKRVAITYDLERAWAGWIDSIVVEDLELQARVTDEGISFGPLDALLAPTDGDGSALPMHVETLRLTGAKVLVDGPVPADLTVDGTLKTDSSDVMSGSFEIRGTVRPAGLTPIPVAGPASLTVESGRLQRASARLSTADLDLPDVGRFEASAGVSYALGTLEADVRLDEGDDSLSVAAKLTGVDGEATNIAGEATFDAAIASLSLSGISGPAGLTGRGAIRLDHNSATLTAETPLVMSLGKESDAVVVGIEPDEIPLATLQRSSEGMIAGQLNLAEGRVTVDAAGVTIDGLEARVREDDAIRLEVSALRLTPDGIAGWETPVVIGGSEAPPEGSISAKHIAIEADAAGLGERRIRALTIEGLDVPAGLSADGEISGPLAPILGLGAATGSEDASGDSASEVDWRIERINLNQARLRISGDVPATIIADGHVEDSQDGSTEAVFDIRAEVAPPGLSPIGITGPASATIAGADLKTLALDLSGSSPDGLTVDLNADYDADGLTARLNLADGDDRVTMDADLPPLQGDMTFAGRALIDLDFALAERAIPGVPGLIDAVGRGSLSIGPNGSTFTASTPVSVAWMGENSSVGARIAKSSTPLITLPAESEGMELRFAAADITIDGIQAAVRDMNAEVSLDENPKIVVRNATVVPKRLAVWSAPVAVSGTAELDLDKETVSFRGRTSSLQRRVRAAVSGSHAMETDRGSLRLRLDPIVFEPDKLQPGQLHPDLGALISEVYGTVNGTATVTWRPDRPTRIDAPIEIDGGSFTAAGIRFSGIDAALRLNGVDPVSTSPEQEIRIAMIDAGVPISDAVIRFGVARTGPVTVTAANFQVFGGNIAARDVAVDRKRSRVSMVLDVAGLDLGRLLDALDVDGLNADGRLAGRLPATLTRDGLAIRGGELRTTKPGTLSYAMESDAALAGTSRGGKLAAQALRNFQYDSLTLTVDGATREGWTVGAVISGRNPDVLNGQPFQFNVNIEGDIEEAVRAALFGTALRDEIQKRILEQRR